MPSLRLAVLLLVTAAACSDDAQPIVDAAPPIDGGFDGNTDRTVTITILLGDGPVATVPVYFQNADSSLVLATVTDATGTASAEMEPGGFVTTFPPQLPDVAAHGPIITDDLVTFAGVKPGDHLVLGEGPRTFVNFMVTFPVEPTTHNYAVYTTCGVQVVSLPTPQTTGTFTAMLSGGACAPTSEVVVVAQTETGAAAITSGPQPITEGATLAITGTYHAMTPSTIRYTNLAGDIYYMSIGQALFTPSGIIYYAADEGFTEGSTMDFNVDEPLAPSAALQTVNAAYFSRNRGSESAIYERGPFTGTYALDVAPVFLPAFAAPGSFDVATHAITWDEDAADGLPDYVRADLSIFRAKSSWSWKIAAPRAATTLTFPVLPAAIADRNPVDGDDVQIYELRAIAVTGGYDAVRERAFRFDEPGDFLTGTGRAVYERVAPQPSLRKHAPRRR